MRKIKTAEEKLWAYLSKKLGNTKTAKEIFHRVSKKEKVSVIYMKYKLDSTELVAANKIAKELTRELAKIKVTK